MDLLLGAVRLQVRHMTEPSGDWEVLVCPGDGGAGVEGYRPLAVALQSEAWIGKGVALPCCLVTLSATPHHLLPNTKPLTAHACPRLAAFGWWMAC